MKAIRSESWTEFKRLVDFESQPAGFKIFKVTIFDDSGNKAGVEYANNDDEKEDMTAVSDGYMYECAWLSKK